MTRTDLNTLNFFSPEVQECPFAIYQQLQEEAPIWQIPNTNMFLDAIQRRA